MPTIPLDLDNPDEADALWRCPLRGLESTSNDYDGQTLHLRCPNGHEWTWDGTWLEWDASEQGVQEQE